jgi:hypothetical protein
MSVLGEGGKVRAERTENGEGTAVTNEEKKQKNRAVLFLSSRCVLSDSRFLSQGVATVPRCLYGPRAKPTTAPVALGQCYVDDTGVFCNVAVKLIRVLTNKCALHVNWDYDCSFEIFRMAAML